MGIDTYTYEIWRDGQVVANHVLRDAQGPFEREIPATLLREMAFDGGVLTITRNTRGVELIATFGCAMSVYNLSDDWLTEEAERLMQTLREATNQILSARQRELMAATKEIEEAS